MSLEAAIQPYLSLVDVLRSHGLDADIQIPQIAVVGDQSSGKSSVLEALTGFPYPRGVGLTTKCPTCVSMRRTEAGSPWRAELTAVQEGVATEAVINDPQDLARRLTELHQASNSQDTQISSKSRIGIRVFAPDVPDLTLVDLPGIVRTTTAGQSKYIIKEVDHMIQEFINLERTIILAVVPANQDIATVDVLERASRVDPAGVRTIGVLTKADLVSPGGEEETIAVLNNAKKPLRLGYVLVKNRNQIQLEQGMTLEEAKHDELQFFRSHPIFNRLEQSLVGVEALSERLTRVLVSRIKAALPSMTQELKQQMKDTATSLEELGQGPPQEQFQQRTELMQIISRFGTLLREVSRGEYRDPLLSSRQELRLRTIVDGMKKKLQIDLIGLRPQFDTDEFRADLRMQLQMLRGREPPGFTNTQFFVTFMTLDMEKWRDLIEASVWNTSQAVKHTCSQLIAAIAPQYPMLANRVVSITARGLEQIEERALSRIEEHLARHTETLATYDDLLQSINTVRWNAFEHALAEVMNNAADRTPGGAKDIDSLRDLVKNQLGAWYMSTHGVTSEYQVDDVRAVLKAYWAVCAKRVHEEICTVLDSMVIGKAIDQFDQELMEFAHIHCSQDPTVLLELFAEPSNVVDHRRMLTAKQQRLRIALEEIRKVGPETPVVAPSVISPTQQFSRGVAAFQKVRAPSPFSSADSSLSPPNSGRDCELEEVKLSEDSLSIDASRKCLQPQDTPKSLGEMSACPPDGVRPISEPERLAADMSDGCVAVFNYTRNGDNRGYVFWLGTTAYARPFENPHTAGRIRVTSSGMAQGEESLILSRQKARAWTRSSTDSFIALDVGRNRSLLLTHVTILHGNPEPGHDMTHYAIEGLDPSTNRWESLTDEMPSVVPSGRVVTVPASAHISAHRKFRLRCTGPQQDGSYSVFIAGLEVYGRLFKQS